MTGDNSDKQYDLVVIGGGPAGYGAALYGAGAGLDVALVERNKLGGTCLNVGCIPAKELLETAHVYKTVSDSSVFGVNHDGVSIDFSASMDRKDKVVKGLVGGVGQLLKGRKVDVYNGTGSLGAGSSDGSKTVTVSAETIGDTEGESATISGKHVLLAAGSVPRTIPGFEVDGNRILTSDEVFSLTELPSSAVVIGGGAIGCEFASMLADLGTEVTIIEALDAILAGCDKDAAEVVARSFKKRKIAVHTGVPVTGQSISDDGITVTYGDDQSITVDKVIVSVGRRPFADHLGLDDAGVKTDERGFIEADEFCRTNVEGVFAAGDVINTPGLAHVGFAEAIVVIKTILGERTIPVDHDRIPWCVYCRPEVAFAGMTEEAAKEAGYDVVVSKHRFTANSRAMIVGDTDGLVKIIAEKNDDGNGGRILGVHMAGPWVTEQLGQGYLAVNWEATVDEVAHYIQPHPTLSELFGETVLSLTGRSLH